MSNITIDIRNSTPQDDKPYGYQGEAIAKLDEYFALSRNTPTGRKSGVIVMPTGSGKTFTSVSWLLDKAAANGFQIIWLVHQQELVTQAYETIKNMSPVLKNYNYDKITIVPVSSKHYSISQAAEADIVVGCIQSFASRSGIKYLDLITKGKGRRKLVVVIDEAHHASSDSYQLVLKQFEKYNPNLILLGMTATPTRMLEAQKRRFQQLFSVIDNVKNGIGTPHGFIYEVALKELLKSGALATPIYRKVETEINGEVEFEFTDEDRKHLEQFGELSEQVKNKVAKSSLRNRIIVDEYIKNRDTYGKTIIFAVNQLHCKTLQKAFEDAGIGNDQCRYAISNEKEQADINIAEFKADKFPILINVQMLTEGFDSPNIQTCFLTRFTQSESLKMQMVGRALRGKRAKGTDIAYIVDFHDMWEGIETDWGGIIEGEQVTTCPHCGSSWNTEENIELTRNGICPFCGEAIKIADEHIEDEKGGVYIPLEVFFRVYSAMRDNLRHHTHKDVVPVGWYTVPNDDGNERIVLVYDHQLYGYKMLENDINENKILTHLARYYIDNPAYFSNHSETNEITQDEWLPDETELQLLIDYANLSGQMPLLYTFEQREALDPYQVAEELGEQNFTGNFFEQSRKADEWLLAKHSNTPILRDLYKSSDDFIRIVKDTMNPPGNGAAIVIDDERGVYEIKPGVYDLEQLRDEVIGEVRAMGVVDKDGKPIFENAIRPAVIWSKRIMKSYYGICYKSDTQDGIGYFIRINKVLSSEQAPCETLKFLIYHELLHANGYWHHDVLFRDAEWQYPNTDEHNSFLDSLSLRFKIVDSDIAMYDKESEIYQHKHLVPETKKSDIKQLASIKRYIAFTSHCTYNIIDENKVNTENYIYVESIPENTENCFMLFAYSDGRFAKVSLNNYNLESRRSEFKNAYSTNSPLVWLNLFESDKDIAVFSSINKVIVFNTRLINAVDSTSSKGVIVQRPKNSSTVTRVALLENSGLSDIDYYHCANIPAIGVYLKKQTQNI